MINKNKHELKRKAERKLMKKMGGRLSEGWIARKDRIARDVKKKEAIAKARSLERNKHERI